MSKEPTAVNPQEDTSLKGFSDYVDYLTYAEIVFPDLLPETYLQIWDILRAGESNGGNSAKSTMRTWKYHLYHKAMEVLMSAAEYDDYVIEVIGRLTETKQKGGDIDIA